MDLVLPAGAGLFWRARGLWGASPGKALFRLQVIRTNGNQPGIWRALFRAIVFTGLSLFAVDLAGLLFFSGKGSRIGDAAQGMLATALMFLFLALLFVKARQRNGYAALHDWLSRTRVFSRKYLANRDESRPQPGRSAATGSIHQPAAANLHLGHYQLISQVRSCASGEIWLGYDPRLLRNVWLRKLPPNAPAVPAPIRNLARPGRLRWLDGERSSNSCWDAYEELTGQPFVELLTEKLSWSALRFWLL